MANTTNFGWETPDDTDLVKDGAAAMRTLGNAIDTSFVDLKGGTTGQMLTKASNTDLDYSWVTPQIGDITAVTAGTGLSGGGTSGDVTLTNTVATAFDAKGDLIGGTGADTFARLAVGTDGQTLAADSTQATGLKWKSDSTNTVIDAKGDLLVGSANDTVARLAVGADYTVVQALASASNGIQYAGGWTSFTPTWTNLTVGNGTVTAAYRRIGDIVDVNVKLAWGSTTSVSGNVSIALPVTAGGNETNAIKQGGVLHKNGAYFWWASVYMVSTTAVRIMSADLASSTNGIAQRDISATVPSTWAANDNFIVSFSYRV